MGENYFGITDAGRQRDNNEDSFIAQRVFNKNCILACVIDGVGGYAGGEVAAQLTRDTIIHQFRKQPVDVTAGMLKALENANERIFKEKEANKENDKMACVVTLAIVDKENNTFRYAHIGDTRLYLFRDNSLVKITHDHSTVGFLEESGRLTETAAMQHPKRNEVNKALGYETGIQLSKDFIDTGESPFLPGDTILLCSDGLSDMISSSRIVSELSVNTDLKTKAKQLVNAANEAGGKDNITVVLVHNDKPPVKLEATKPAINSKQEHGVDTVDLGGTQNEHTITIRDEDHVKKKGTNKGMLILLILLCLVFIAGFAWFMAGGMQKPKVLMPPKPKEANTGDQQVRDSFRLSATKVVSLDASRPVTLQQAIVIEKDSLHIKGNGIDLSNDTAFKGAAFILAPGCRHIVFDSITLSNFTVGILVQDKGLHLKNVKFVNCSTPVQFSQQLPQNKFVSGSQAQTIFYNPDSLSK